VNDCVNLRETFGERFRIAFDPAYDHRGVPRAKLDPWMMTIPCQGGITIYPHGGELLAVEVDYHPGIAKKLAAVEGVRLHQNGDGEKTFTFPVGLFDGIAGIVKPKRRRRLTDAQRAICRERLAKVRAASPT
jgi:hypothetical protein